MIKRIFRLFILVTLFSTAGFSVFADQPSSALDDKPSVDAAASTGVQVPAIPSDATADTHTSYLYDLKKLIDKSRENIKEVNDKIKEQAVLKRNQMREERSHEYYEKGVELTKEGKLDEAREYFDKAIRITEHPEMAGYIKESQRRLRRQEAALHDQERAHFSQIKKDENTRKEDVEAAYKEAVDLFKQKKYHPAKDAFEHVDEIAPDYRATNSYLKIIDQDIVMADALAVKQQAVEVARQQKEAEAARAKEKAVWLAQIEEKEKERKEAVDKQAADVYNQAVELYKKNKFAEAKKKFEEVSWVIPNYKDTMKYLRRIDKDAQEQQQRDAEEQQKALQDQRWEETVEGKKQEAQKEKELEAKELQHKKDLEEQAQFLYAAAVTLYDKKNMELALAKFVDIENTCPDYKSTRSYIARIEQSNPELKSKVVITPPQQATPAQPNPLAVSIEDQQKQMHDIADLARRAANLYTKIADMADDSSTYQMKRKMAEVDEILNNLKEKKEHLLHQMRDEQWKRQQEERKAQAEKMYQEGRDFFSSHDYAKAKTEFLQLEYFNPDYKSTRRYLRHIAEYEKEANVVLAGNVENVVPLQSKENAGELTLAQQEQEKQHNMQLQQQAAIQNLAEKATSINDDIILLSRQQDYEGMKAKFTELENTVTALTTLKEAMADQKNHQKREQQLARESANQRIKILKEQDRQDKQIHTYDIQKPPKENRPVFSSPSSDEEQYKHREITQEQNSLFNEGVDLYRHNQYVQAKLLFGELAGQHDRRGEDWLKKVDRAIAQDILRKEAVKERERTEFIAEQVKAQRQLLVIQERERQRQKKLTEELERQKRMYEDDRSLQMRKEATMKAQERERQIQEEKRLQLEKTSEQQQEMYRFHKIRTLGSQAAAAGVPAAQQPVLAVSTPGVGVVSTPGSLEARREAVRKQLVDGVEAMYQEALKLYNQGNYSAAVDKFKDVQDIFPGYKSTGQYMDDARMKSMNINSQTVFTPEMSGASANVSTPSVATSASPSVSRQNAVSKALDLFDPDAR